MLPPAILGRAFLMRGARIWALVRATASVAMLFALVPPADVVRQPAAGALLLVAISVGACFADSWRHGEQAFLRNLAVSPVAMIALFAGPALLGESLLFFYGLSLLQLIA
jgi:hypothetical protein